MQGRDEETTGQVKKGSEEGHKKDRRNELRENCE